MANFNFNHAIIAGKITRDPELRQTQSGIATVTFTVAVNRKPSKNGEAQTDFFNVTAWRQTAELIAKYFRKRSSICVVGSIQNRSYEDKNGQKKYITEIVAENVNFVDPRSENPAGNQGEIPGVYAQPKPAPKLEALSLDDDDPEIPF